MQDYSTNEPATYDSSVIWVAGKLINPIRIWSNHLESKQKTQRNLCEETEQHLAQVVTLRNKNQFSIACLKFFTFSLLLICWRFFWLRVLLLVRVWVSACIWLLSLVSTWLLVRLWVCYGKVKFFWRVFVTRIVDGVIVLINLLICLSLHLWLPSVKINETKPEVWCDE